MTKLDRDWMTLPDGSKVPRPRRTIKLTSSNQPDYTDRDELREKIATALNEAFGMNYIDPNSRQMSVLVECAQSYTDQRVQNLKTDLYNGAKCFHENDNEVCDYCQIITPYLNRYFGTLNTESK